MQCKLVYLLEAGRHGEFPDVQKTYEARSDAETAEKALVERYRLSDARKYTRITAINFYYHY